METIYKYLGAVIALILVVAGGVVYNVTITEDNIVATWENEDCGEMTFIVDKDSVNKFKCGRFIIAEWDTVVLHEVSSYSGTSYKADDRKKTKTEQYIVENTPEYYKIEQKTYYKLGSSGSDGILTETYTFSEKGLKWSYNYESENSRNHYVVLRMKRFEEKYGYEFSPEDPNGLLEFTDTASKSYPQYYYGGIQGNLVIDPEIFLQSSLKVGEYELSKSVDGISYKEVREKYIADYDHWKNVSDSGIQCNEKFDYREDNCESFKNEINDTVCCNITHSFQVWDKNYEGEPIYKYYEPIAIIYDDKRIDFVDYGYFVCDEIYVEETDKTFTGKLINGLSTQDGYIYSKEEDMKCVVESGQSVKIIDLETGKEIYQIGYYGQ